MEQHTSKHCFMSVVVCEDTVTAPWPKRFSLKISSWPQNTSMPPTKSMNSWKMRTLLRRRCLRKRMAMRGIREEPREQQVCGGQVRRKGLAETGRAGRLLRDYVHVWREGTECVEMTRSSNRTFLCLFWQDTETKPPASFLGHRWTDKRNKMGTTWRCSRETKRFAWERALKGNNFSGLYAMRHLVWRNMSVLGSGTWCIEGLWEYHQEICLLCFVEQMSLYFISFSTRVLRYSFRLKYHSFVFRDLGKTHAAFFNNRSRHELLSLGELTVFHWKLVATKSSLLVFLFCFFNKNSYQSFKNDFSLFSAYF